MGPQQTVQLLIYTLLQVWDVAVGLVTGIWVKVVATAGVGAAELTGAVGVVVIGTGWAKTLTLHPLLAIMVLFSCQEHFPWILGLF